MVLKKPYALLIKYFRHIHVFLSAVTAVILFCFYNIYSVFRTYTNSGWLTAKNMILDHNYISAFLVILIIINIIALVILYILMRYKDKPRLFYIISIAINILITILLIFDNNIFNQITQDVISSTTLRLYRDINAISLFIIGIILLILLIRSVGFDIQKFDFGKDLQEFKVTSEDSEEFELQLGVDDEEYKRKFRKKIREFKIYYKENKFIVNIILFIILFIILSVLSSVFIFNNTYRQGRNVKIDNNIYLKVTDSYVTKYNDYNIQITNDIILIVQFSITNKSKEDYKLDTNNLNIIQGGTVRHPITTEYSNFLNYGIGYTNQIVEAGNVEHYFIIYEISEQKKYNKTYLVRNNNKIKIKPKQAGEISNPILGNQVIFNVDEDTSITFTVSEVLISDNFYYVEYIDNEYVELSKLEGEKKDDETIIKLLNTELYMTVNEEKIPWKSFDGYLTCVIDGREKEFAINNFYMYQNNSTIFLIVPEEIKRSNKIMLNLKFLDYTIHYILKNG